MNSKQAFVDLPELTVGQRLKLNEDALKIIERIQSAAFAHSLNKLQVKSCVAWSLRFMHFSHNKALDSFKQSDLERYLSYLAGDLNLEYDEQQNAVEDLSFLFKQILNVKLGDLHFLRRKKRRGFFSKFERQQCLSVINHLEGTNKLIARVALECNLKLREVIGLRLADLDLKRSQLMVRDSSGDKKFIAKLPVSLNLELRIQVMRVKRLVQLERETHHSTNNEELNLLANQLQPEWQYLFPHSFANTKKKTLSRLNQTPLKVLKSDILLAIKQFKRFNPVSDSHSLITSIYKNRSVKVPNQDALARLNHIRQTAFNFSDNLGAA